MLLCTSYLVWSVYVQVIWPITGMSKTTIGVGRISRDETVTKVKIALIGLWADMGGS